MHPLSQLQAAAINAQGRCTVLMPRPSELVHLEQIGPCHMASPKTTPILISGSTLAAGFPASLSAGPRESVGDRVQALVIHDPGQAPTVEC